MLSCVEDPWADCLGCASQKKGMLKREIVGLLSCQITDSLLVRQVVFSYIKIKNWRQFKSSVTDNGRTELVDL